MDASERIPLADATEVSWLRIVDEYTGGFLLTRVFSLGAVDGRAGVGDRGDAAPSLRALGPARPHPRGQRLALGRDGGPADGAGVVAAGPGDRPGRPTGRAGRRTTAWWSARRTPGSGGRTRGGAPRPRSCSATSTPWTGTNGRRSRMRRTAGCGCSRGWRIRVAPIVGRGRRRCGSRQRVRDKLAEYAVVRQINARGLVSIYWAELLGGAEVRGPDGRCAAGRRERGLVVRAGRRPGDRSPSGRVDAGGDPRASCHSSSSRQNPCRVRRQYLTSPNKDVGMPPDQSLAATMHGKKQIFQQNFTLRYRFPGFSRQPPRSPLMFRRSCQIDPGWRTRPGCTGPEVTKIPRIRAPGPARPPFQPDWRDARAGGRDDTAVDGMQR